MAVREVRASAHPQVQVLFYLSFAGNLRISWGSLICPQKSPEAVTGYACTLHSHYLSNGI